MVNTVAYSTWYFLISPVGSYLGGNILWNLRVRISDPWKKVPLEKCLKFYFSLKHPKWSLQREGWGCRWPCSQVNVPFYFPEMPFFPQNCPFIFQNCPFISWNCPFVFQKCLFISQKMAYCFSGLHFSFPEMPSLLYYAHLFPRMLFFQLIVPSCPAQSGLER